MTATAWGLRVLLAALALYGAQNALPFWQVPGLTTVLSTAVAIFPRAPLAGAAATLATIGLIASALVAISWAIQFA